MFSLAVCAAEPSTEFGFINGFYKTCMFVLSLHTPTVAKKKRWGVYVCFSISQNSIFFLFNFFLFKKKIFKHKNGLYYFRFSFYNVFPLLSGLSFILYISFIIKIGKLLYNVLFRSKWLHTTCK